ncbi:protein of unknown function (plasmid) [Cupriavidus taiwanensis]|uniref:Uncharacterized protein n=1 Tax=Cupriavidus taiwanensis TaxID=164546 RepID=A0A375EC23_9BURK|nr:protein of unknown function [Cupriavidus taiwanensis]SOZ74697.1 protein of unknown function [Cupriavidus taiwanensis]SPA11474.1 protein of unknown function [Cupriavidus taiwanensis]
MFGDLLDHLESTGKGESEFLWVFIPLSSWKSGCLATSRFLDSVRMNQGYNILKLHS